MKLFLNDPKSRKSMKKLLLFFSLFLLFTACQSDDETEPEQPKEIKSIAITPQFASVRVGKTSSFTATATYDDGSTGNVNTRLQWSSTDTGVATINGGTATGKSVGTTSICASYNSITCDSPSLLTVTPAIVNANIENEYGREIVYEIWSGTGSLSYDNGYVVGYGEKSFPSTSTPASIAVDSSSDTQISDDGTLAYVLIVIGVPYQGQYYYLVDERFSSFDATLDIKLCNNGKLIDESISGCL